MMEDIAMTEFRINRRSYLKAATAGLAGTVAAVAFAGSAKASSKVTKAQADYVDHPGSGGAKCSTCVNYIPTGSKCMLVQGVVSPNGFCKFYSPKG
jgi:uncharacterized Fe-S center protein